MKSSPARPTDYLWHSGGQSSRGLPAERDQAAKMVLISSNRKTARRRGFGICLCLRFPSRPAQKPMRHDRPQDPEAQPLAARLDPGRPACRASDGSALTYRLKGSGREEGQNSARLASARDHPASPLARGTSSRELTILARPESPLHARTNGLCAILHFPGPLMPAWRDQCYHQYFQTRCRSLEDVRVP